MSSAVAGTLVAGAKKIGVQLEADAVERLERFLSLFAVWNRRVRLTGERDLTAVIERHVIDSVAPAPYLPGAGLVVDIGTGGGFPGIILGCVRPDLELALVESRRRRVSFLREAIRSIPLTAARALEVRAEGAADDPAVAQRAAVVTGRAIRLDVFLALATPLLAPDGRAIAMQTPQTARRHGGSATAGAMELVARHDYVLPRGALRTLLVFTRRRETVP